MEKKSQLRKKDFIDYYAKKRLENSDQSIDDIFEKIKQAIPKWRKLIEISFLDTKNKQAYRKLLDSRCERLI